mmetsp:Transcript_26712/g.49002  ORF Transcript_26712/g.49002 Transcript_26712/m.49002 type:complete len:670 (-) Transcript_26712:100-2109(-)
MAEQPAGWQAGLDASRSTPCRRRPQSATGCTRVRRTSLLGCLAAKTHQVPTESGQQMRRRPQSAGGAAGPCSACTQGSASGKAGTDRLFLLQQHHEKQLKILQQLHQAQTQESLPSKTGCMPLWVSTTGNRSSMAARAGARGPVERSDDLQLATRIVARPQSAGVSRGARRQAVGQRPWTAGYGRYACRSEAPHAAVSTVPEVRSSPLQQHASRQQSTACRKSVTAGSKEGVERGYGLPCFLELPDAILVTLMSWSLASDLTPVCTANRALKVAVERAVQQILLEEHGLGSAHSIRKSILPLRQLHLLQHMTERRTSRMSYLRGPVVLSRDENQHHCNWWADEGTWLLSPRKCLSAQAPVTIASLACGRNHLLFLDNLGSLWALGDSRAAGVLEAENELRQPTLVKAMQGVHLAKVACGNGHSVAISSGSTGDVFLWGRSLVHSGGWSPPSPRRRLSGEAVDISAGESHVAAASLAGDTYVWGHNHHGQCARDPAVSTLSSPVRAVHALEDAVSRRVACGRYHTAVLSADGSLFTFGASMSGQLGRQSGWPLGPSWQPEKVSFSSSQGASGAVVHIVQVACGDEHTLCLSDRGRLFVFGCGDHGQLGLGGVRSHRTPTAARIFKRVGEIAAGGSWSLIRTNCGRVHLAGRGEDDPDKDCRLLKQIVAPC